MASRTVAAVRIRLLTGLIAAAVALAACGDGEGGGGGDAAGSASVPEADLLSFEAETIAGDAVDVSEYAGSDLVIWFWAPW